MYVWSKECNNRRNGGQCLAGGFEFGGGGEMQSILQLEKVCR